MKYEIDFIGINKEGKDADAICFRYFSESDNKYHIGIYDGGTTDYGIEMKNHIKKYYKHVLIAYTSHLCIIKCNNDSLWRKVLDSWSPKEKVSRQDQRCSLSH